MVVMFSTFEVFAKVDINNGTVNEALKIVDEAQADGRVLTSDANSLGTWRNATVTNLTRVTPNVSTPYGTTADKYMNGKFYHLFEKIYSQKKKRF